MPGEESHSAAFQCADNDRVRRIAKRSLHAKLTCIGEPLHAIESASAYNSNANHFLRSSTLFPLRRSRHSIYLYSETRSINRNGLGFPLAVAFTQISGGHFRIVRKKRYPALANCLRNPLFFIFQRGHRIQVISHDPRQRQVGRSRNQVREEECGLVSAG